jgi:hypothetical protein
MDLDAMTAALVQDRLSKGSGPRRNQVSELADIWQSLDAADQELFLNFGRKLKGRK